MNLNLCTDPWLPVRMKSGDCIRVSLEDLFQKGNEISDLVLAAHERVSIMRLLICIAQRAIDGPSDRDEWDECMEDIAPAAVKYLQGWRHAFNLLGEDGAFLQVKGVEPCNDSSWKSMGALSLSSAEGNNPTLFDNSAGKMRSFSLAQTAIDLITFQNFAPGGTMGTAVWAGEKTGKEASDKVPAAPCTPKSAIHQFIIGRNIIYTIWLNMCPIENIRAFRTGMGRPVWEQMPVKMDDCEARKNATLSYLGRLVPVSRTIKIAPDAQSCIVARGLTYPVYDVNNKLQYFESSMSFDIKDGERFILGADLNRALWRSLPAILHRYGHKRLDMIGLDEEDLPENFGVWVGALVYDRAKVLGEIDDYFERLTRYHVGSSAFAVQVKLMEYAAKGANAILGAVKEYYNNIRPYQVSKNEKSKKSDVYEELIKKAHNNSKLLYWGYLTARKDLYIKAIGVLAQDGKNGDGALDEWLSAICEGARETFNRVVPCDSVRQMAAWAGALRYLPTKFSITK